MRTRMERRRMKAAKRRQVRAYTWLEGMPMPQDAFVYPGDYIVSADRQTTICVTDPPVFVPRGDTVVIRWEDCDPAAVQAHARASRR